jgi:hypothetical protein
MTPGPEGVWRARLTDDTEVFLRASVGSTDAAKGVVARFGLIDRSKFSTAAPGLF